MYVNFALFSGAALEQYLESEVMKKSSVYNFKLRKLRQEDCELMKASIKCLNMRSRLTWSIYINSPFQKGEEITKGEKRLYKDFNSNQCLFKKTFH